MDITPEQIEALKDETIEHLDKGYDLVYVSQGDKLQDEQVDALIRGDWETVWDLSADWEAEARYDTAILVVEEVAKAVLTEWERRDDRDYDHLWDEFYLTEEWREVIEAVQDRDTSDPIRDLARGNGRALCRTTILDEDHPYIGRGDLTRTEVLKDLGLKRNKQNLAVIGECLANANHSQATLMASIVYAVEVTDLLDIDSEAEYIDIVNPHVWLGNPWQGNGYCEGPVDGTFRIKREDLHADGEAFGYGWNEVSGGVYTGDYETEIRVVAA